METELVIGERFRIYKPAYTYTRQPLDGNDIEYFKTEEFLYEISNLSRHS